jgi:hypothetical protein
MKKWLKSAKEICSSRNTDQQRLKIMPSNKPRFGRWRTRPMMGKPTAIKEECAQLKRKPLILHTCQRKRLLFSKTENEILLRQISLDHNANYLQMKSLNGFSNLPARTDGFTAESECRNGFPAETLVCSPSSSPNSISQMNSQ